jgi:hypothetical protein
VSRRQSSAGGNREPAAFQRLEKRANAGLEWLSRNLHQFAPLEKFDPSPRIKPFTELAILYERLRSVERGPLAARLELPHHLRRWRRFLLEHCEDRAFAELGRRIPSHAYALLLPYLTLRTTGYRSPFHEETLREAWTRGFLFAVEVVPHRVLDREYFLWKAGLLRSEPNWSKLYANTVLAVAPDALHLDREAAYAITHTLFYLSDWGRRPPPFDEAEAERVTRILDCLMVHYWRLRHWDLLGELLTNRVSMPTRGSHLVTGASAAFLNAWRLDGCIPGEGLDIEGLEKSPPSERESLIFRECYHSTLVGVLYCVSALESRRLRP